MICSLCGKETKRLYPKNTCQGCYNYFRKGGLVYELPPPGTIQKDENGKVICHICGRSFLKLGGHIKESHNLTIFEYKEMFGLCKNTKTTESNYSKKMSNYALENNMDKQLLMAGLNTRFKKGNSCVRKGKKISLQERKRRGVVV